MRRSEDPILVRAELVDLDDRERENALVDLIVAYRGGMERSNLSVEKIRNGSCDCGGCQMGRVLDNIGML